MSTPRLAYSRISSVQTKAPRPVRRNAVEKSQHGVVWAIDESGHIRTLDGMEAADAAPGCMFLRAGSMSRMATARLLSLFARELAADGQTH